MRKKLLLTLLTLGVTASLATLATFSAFTATTANAGNSIESGSVALSDNDSGSAMYNITNGRPTESQDFCIKVSYGGSLASTVKLYMATAVTNGSLFNIQVERGNSLSDFGDACTDFVADATIFGPDTLENFQVAHSSWANGLDAGDGTAWDFGESIDYRFTITTNDDPTVDAHTVAMSSGLHDFTWEAQNN